MAAVGKSFKKFFLIAGTSVARAITDPGIAEENLDSLTEIIIYN